jgi:soluble lytic murein transglycosylase
VSGCAQRLSRRDARRLLDRPRGRSAAQEPEAKQRYQEAARYATSYYGQIARARAGLGELTLNPFPALSSTDRSKAMSSDIQGIMDRSSVRVADRAAAYPKSGRTTDDPHGLSRAMK